jgi:hypothetical protein
VVCGGFSAPLQHSEQVIIVATNDFDSIFAANRIATAIGIKQKTGGGTLAGLVANRASNAELVGPFAERIGSVCLTCIPENDGVRKSRLTAQTVFEMDTTGALGAPWMDLAKRMLAGVPLTIPTPIPERELFTQLGADYVRGAARRYARPSRRSRPKMRASLVWQNSRSARSQASRPGGARNSSGCSTCSTFRCSARMPFAPRRCLDSRTRPSRRCGAASPRSNA